MPVCPSCDMAYLDGERHSCTPRTRPLRLILAIGGGAIAGAVCGWFSFIAVACNAYPDAQCGLIGPFVGAPVGAIVGGAIGVVIARAAR